MAGPQNQHMSRYKSVRHLGLYGYIWEWDGENSQGNRWHKYDRKEQDSLNAALVLREYHSGTKELDLGKYFVNLHSLQQTNKATGYKRPVRKLPSVVVSRPDNITSTMLRKVASNAKDDTVWVPSRTSVKNCEVVAILEEARDGFTKIRTSGYVEGYIRSAYLHSADPPVAKPVAKPAVPIAVLAKDPSMKDVKPLTVAPGAWSTFEGGKQEWKGGDGCNFFDDPLGCMYTCCCPCCMLCSAAERLKRGHQGASFPDADMFLCAGQIISCLSVSCFPFGICIGTGCPCECCPPMCGPNAGACPQHVGCGCYTTSLIKMTMQKYDLDYPEPMGSEVCCGCCPDGRGGLCSAFWCHECMLCLVWRELKAREIEFLHKQAQVI